MHYLTSFFHENKLTESEIREYRSFIMTKHARLGYLLLKSRKAGDGSFQLPGGRMDRNDLNKAEQNFEKATSICAARELWEETGIDVRSNIERLVPLYNRGVHEKNRYFFELIIDDTDLEKIQKNDFKKNGINLSSEHSDYIFVEGIKVPNLIKNHSSGKCRAAFLSYISRN